MSRETLSFNKLKSFIQLGDSECRTAKVVICMGLTPLRKPFHMGSFHRPLYAKISQGSLLSLFYLPSQSQVSLFIFLTRKKGIIISTQEKKHTTEILLCGISIKCMSSEGIWLLKHPDSCRYLFKVPGEHDLNFISSKNDCPVISAVTATCNCSQ